MQAAQIQERPAEPGSLFCACSRLQASDRAPSGASAAGTQHVHGGCAQGETVPYIICCEVDEEGRRREGAPAGLAERAYHREELAANPSLRVDTEYYLANQVGPCTYWVCWQSQT